MADAFPGERAGAATARIAILETDIDARMVVATLDPGATAVLSVEALTDGIADASIDCALLSQHALLEIDLRPVEKAIAAQPGWSDFPFLVLAEENGTAEFSHRLDRLGNAGLLEAPVRPDLLASALRIALRARTRQRGCEAHFAQGEAAEIKLLDLADTLEARVRERMRDLRQAHDRLLHEVQERREADVRLRESEELYRHTVELSQQVAWTANPDGRPSYVSPRFRVMTGLDDEPATAWEKAVHPDDVAMAREHWARIRAEETNVTADFRLRMADGEYRYVRSRMAPRRDAEGKIIRWYGMTEDIDDQRRAERARRAAEERYRLAAQATDDAIWDTDLATDRVQWSGSARGLFGYPEGETALDWWLERIHPDDRARVAANFQRARVTGRRHWSATYRFMAADGTYADVHDRGFMVRDDEGMPIRAVGAMANITERIRAENETRRLQAELLEVSQASAMGTVASTLAHELNQPLTATLNYLRGSRKLLSESASVDTQVEEALRQAEVGARSAATILQRLREMVGRGAFVTRPEPLRKLIEDAVSLALIDGRDTRIVPLVTINPAAEWVRVDAVQVQQVLTNLLRNAAEAMHDSPVRALGISAAPATDDMVEVAVSDTGTGLAGVPRETLFSPFRSTKPEGMGIGLSISRTIVEAHGGRIRAEDADGGGAIFRFKLPRADAP